MRIVQYFLNSYKFRDTHKISKIAIRSVYVLFTLILLYSIYGMISYYIDDYRNKSALDEIRKNYYSPATSTSFEVSASDDHLNSDESIIPAATDNGKIISQNMESVNQHLELSRKVQERFNELLLINEDVVGWIRINDTPIDYPVVQSEDNEFYLERDILKKNNVNGSIFMDFRNNIDSVGNDQHIILYGHNMRNKSMFAALLHYESEWYLKQHPVIQFDTLYENRTWEIFAVNKTDIHRDYIRTDFADKEDFIQFITELKNTSLHQIDVQLHADDVILTLSTCSSISDEARFAIHARLITESDHKTPD